jgi:hypothetical protein
MRTLPASARTSLHDEGTPRRRSASSRERAVCSRSSRFPSNLAATRLEHPEWLAAQARVEKAQPLLAEAREIFERLEAKGGSGGSGNDLPSGAMPRP